MANKFRTWIFILKEGMLAGRFYISPFYPSAEWFKAIDAGIEIEERKLLYNAYDAVLEADKKYALLTETKHPYMKPWVRIHQGIRSYARCVQVELLKRYGYHVPIEVIPYGEFITRAAAGEFEYEVSSDELRMQAADVFGTTMQQVINKRFQALGPKERDNFMCRLRHAEPDTVRNRFKFKEPEIVYTRYLSRLPSFCYEYSTHQAAV